MTDDDINIGWQRMIATTQRLIDAKEREIEDLLADIIHTEILGIVNVSGNE